MNRIDRISAILIQLQSHSLVKAQQISERFDISIRTVYRDIRTLEEAGIPITGNPGIGYSLAEGFKLFPLMFTPKEALSFLIAEKLVHELTDSNSNEHYKSGIEKILTFRIDRIQEMHMLDEVQSQEHPPLKKFIREFYDKEKLYEIVIRIEKDKISMMNDDKYYYGLTSEKEIGNMIEFHFLTFSISKFAHWYVSFADGATIITPDSLKHEVKKIINNISI